LAPVRKGEACANARSGTANKKAIATRAHAAFHRIFLLIDSAPDGRCVRNDTTDISESDRAFR
jgi:hypothetical protein